MDIRKIDEGLFGFAADRGGGRRHRQPAIVCHRPNLAQADQPAFSVIADRAAQLGIAVRHIPVLSTGLTDEAVGSMVQALDDLPRPILAYCRSGARSTKIYEQALLPR